MSEVPETPRYSRGLETLRRIAGERSSAPLHDWNEIAPDMHRFIVEFICGDLLSRPGLDLKTRQIATVAALTALNSAPAELKQHIHGAFEMGWTDQEVVEVILQMAAFAGFPAALNGLTIASQAIHERENG